MHGRLRIYLGSAPGVGKTFAMLNEGWRRRERGTDVVIGLVVTHDRPATIAQIRDLEVVAPRRVEYRGQVWDEMDVGAILARRPTVVLVDELAHTNVPGSRHEKRWQDIGELLDAGIEVISTLNIQHLESLNDVVNRITGVVQRETVPDAVVRRADQVELIDMSPEALQRRMAHGNIYAPEKVDAALGNYFRLGQSRCLARARAALGGRSCRGLAAALHGKGSSLYKSLQAHSLYRMRCLIIGGTRAIGPYVVGSLHLRGWNVAVLHRGIHACGASGNCPTIHIRIRGHTRSPCGAGGDQICARRRAPHDRDGPTGC